MGTNRRKAVKDRKKRRVLARKENAKKVAARLLGTALKSSSFMPDSPEWKALNWQRLTANANGARKRKRFTSIILFSCAISYILMMPMI